MRVVGVIAEYDPFHLGHAYHLRQARAQTGADWVLCVMSGCFTQRGQGALLSPSRRARMALACGADAVVELPVLWAVREAEHFALGGVSMLHPRLAQGLSHAAALGGALETRFPGLGLDKPNNVLGMCYLRALLRLQASIVPSLVPRRGEYHDTGWSNGLPSATAVRGAIARGDWLRVSQAMPREAYAILRDAAQQGELFHAEALDPVLLHLLRTATPETLRRLPGCGEGMENRLAAAARASASRNQLLAAVKTRRYPYARLSRMCAHLMLGFTQQELRPDLLPPYARLLGFRKEARPLIQALKASGFPLVERAACAPRDDAVFQADMRAYDLWCLGAGQPAGLGYRQQMAIWE